MLRCSHPTLTHIRKHNYHCLSLGGIFFMILPRTHLDRHLESPFKAQDEAKSPYRASGCCWLMGVIHWSPGSLREWDSFLACSDSLWMAISATKIFASREGVALGTLLLCLSSQLAFQLYFMLMEELLVFIFPFSSVICQCCLCCSGVLCCLSSFPVLL